MDKLYWSEKSRNCDSAIIVLLVGLGLVKYYLWIKDSPTLKEFFVEFFKGSHHGLHIQKSYEWKFRLHCDYYDGRDYAIELFFFYITWKY